MKSLLLVALLAVGFSFNASADQSDTAANETCFLENRVRSYEVEDRNTLVVKTRRNQFFKIETGICTELAWGHAIAFANRGGQRVCRGDQLLIVDHFYPNRIIERCWIRSVTEVAP